MTSFGIEWDTTALVFFENQQLPPGIITKTPAIMGSNWTISLDATDLAKRRGDKKGKILKTDCLYGLEAQLGVFRSTSETQFDVKSFLSTCEEFQKFWLGMVSAKAITIDEKKYPVLTIINMPYNETRGKTSRLGIFKDCARSIPGTVREGKMEWFYRELLNTVSGKPQLTMGIRLKYVISVFTFFSNLLNTCETKDQKSCRSIGPSLLVLKQIRRSLYDSAVQLQSLGITSWVEVEGSGISDQMDVVALIILTNSYLISIDLIQTLRKRGSEAYGKSLILLKLRSNLRIIYDKVLTDSGKEFYEIWATNMAFVNGYTGIDQKICKQFYLRFFLVPFTPMYQIRARPGFEGKVKVPKLSIVTIPSDEMKNIERIAIIDRVNTIEPYSLIARANPPAPVKYEEGYVVFTKTFNVQDYMEWGVEGKDNIIIELRGIHVLSSLAGMVRLNRYSKEKRRPIDVKRLCPYIRMFIQNVLNPMIQTPLDFPSVQIENYTLRVIDNALERRLSPEQKDKIYRQWEQS